MLKHLCDALSDAEQWWIDALKDGPCDACLKGNAPKLGPSGTLPTDEGLLFGDIWHVSCPAWRTKTRMRLGLVHAASGFARSVPLKLKSDAKDAFVLVEAYFNSMGRRITWAHFV